MTLKSPSSESSSAARRAADASALILRLVLAFVFVAHGSQKLFGAFGGGGISGTATFFASLGATPGMFWAVVVGLVEFGGGIALCVGFLSRISATLIATDMVVAIVTYNAHNGFFVETPTGGWEINLVLIAMTASIAVTGGGRFAVDRGLRRALAMLSSPLVRII